MALLRLDLIGHSGFALECAECVLVFDLYLDPASVMERVIGLGKPVVFFSSHAHSDHWNPGWLEYKIPTACYIVDDSCDPRPCAGGSTRSGSVLPRCARIRN
jgi:L-ascorbate metabolism protein UlaG (beta-lactamase superfamily)